MAKPDSLSRHPVVLLSPRALLGSLFSFEALLVLYLFAGVYKGDPRFAWIPTDPTGLFFALSVVAGAFILVLNPFIRRAVPVIGAMLCLVAWFALTLLWSPSQVYGPAKVFFMATLELWALAAAAMIIAPSRERQRRLFTLILLFSIWLGIEALLVYQEQAGTRLEVGSGNYLALGRVCGLGAMIAFVAWIASGRRRLIGLVFLGLCAGLGFVLLVGGGRGPLIASMGSLLLPMLVGMRVTRHGIGFARYQGVAIGLLMGVMAGVVVWAQLSENEPKTLERLDSILGAEDLDRSAAGRLRNYDLAIEHWSSAPVVGHGAGSWPLLLEAPDEPRHPHNMFLEVLVEAGLIGFALLIALFGAVLRPLSFARLRSDPAALCALMLFTNSFLNAMVSGDLPDNRVMFMTVGLLTVLALPQRAPDARLASGLGSRFFRPAAPALEAPPLASGSARRG